MKNLRFALMSVLMVFAGSVFAQTEFDFDTNGSAMFNLPGESSNDSHDGDFTEAKSATIGDFTVTVSAANEGVSNANRIWNSAPKLRMYSGTLTIASSGATISKVEFTLAPQASKAKWGADNSASSGTIDAEAKTSVTWTGSASEVVFTIAGNTQISKITINGEGGGEVTPPVSEVEQITVARALEIIEGLDNGAKTTEEYEVKGFVIGDPDFQRNSTDGSLYGNVNLQMADEVGGTAMLTVYRAKDLDNADFTEETINRIKEGDVVVFKGKLQKYVKDEVVTPELTNGYLISVNPDDTPVVKPAEPVFDPKDGAEFSESIVVTITCATDGATIYYRNARATDTYTVYTEPITLTETTMLEAYAEKDGVKSEKMGALYTKVETPVAEGIVFDFDNDYATLFPTLKGGVSSSDSDAGDFTETTSSIEIEGVTVIVSAKEEGKTNNNRIWTSAPRLRMYSGTFTVTGKDIVKIEFTANSNFNLSTETGTLDGKTWTGKADEVVFAVTKNTQINKIVVTLDTSTAIQAVESTRNDGIIYNMAGQRVEKAQKGLYIMNGRKFMVK